MKILYASVIVLGGLFSAAAMADQDQMNTQPQGTNVQQGKDILANSGLPIVAANDLGDAAAKIVAEVRRAA